MSTTTKWRLATGDRKRQRIAAFGTKRKYSFQLLFIAFSQRLCAVTAGNYLLPILWSASVAINLYLLLTCCRVHIFFACSYGHIVLPSVELFFFFLCFYFLFFVFLLLLKAIYATKATVLKTKDIGNMHATNVRQQTVQQSKKEV